MARFYIEETVIYELIAETEEEAKTIIYEYVSGDKDVLVSGKDYRDIDYNTTELKNEDWDTIDYHEKEEPQKK